MIVNYYPGGNVYSTGAPIKYTGAYRVEIDDESSRGEQDWKVYLLSSGTLTVTKDVNVDLFLVGGGGGGSNCYKEIQEISTYTKLYGGGGAGGYVRIDTNRALRRTMSYTCVIGNGGAHGVNSGINNGDGGDGEPTSFSDGSIIVLTAAGGEGGKGIGENNIPSRATGGRNGGLGAYYMRNGSSWNAAESGHPWFQEAFGAGDTVNEFGEDGGMPYCGGGAGGSAIDGGSSSGYYPT